MSSLSWLARTSVLVALSVVAAVWTGLAGQYFASALFGCATVLLIAMPIVHGVRHASAVIAGADLLIEDHRRLARSSESASVRPTSASR